MDSGTLDSSGARAELITFSLSIYSISGVTWGRIGGGGGVTIFLRSTGISGIVFSFEWLGGNLSTEFQY